MVPASLPSFCVLPATKPSGAGADHQSAPALGGLADTLRQPLRVVNVLNVGVTLAVVHHESCAANGAERADNGGVGVSVSLAHWCSLGCEALVLAIHQPNPHILLSVVRPCHRSPSFLLLGLPRVY